METTYTYSIATDFPASTVDVGNLSVEIASSAITIALKSVVIDPVGNDADRIDIIFKDALSVGDKTIFDGDATGPAGGLIAAHDNVAVDDVQTVHLDVADSGDLTQPVLRMAPTVARPGFYRCDRDIKLLCGVYEATAGESFEDIKMNIDTNERDPWGEVSLVGIYKDVAGTMTLCDDQTDADAEAIMSVWDYQAVDPTDGTTPIEIEILGGGLSIGSSLTEPSAGEKWNHQLYIVMAPGISESLGGRVKFFDGYLKPYEGKTMESVNAMALALKPNPLAGNINTVIRTYVWYPKTAKDIHVLRLTTYRQLGSF